MVGVNREGHIGEENLSPGHSPGGLRDVPGMAHLPSSCSPSNRNTCVAQTCWAICLCDGLFIYLLDV